MHRIKTSRQTIAAKQRNASYHPDGRVAPHIKASTIYFESTKQVLEIIAENAAQIGRLAIEEGQHLHIVASKFANRYYPVADDDKCSATDDRVAARCVALVQAYRIQQKAA